MDRPWSRVPSWVGAALRPELAGATDEVIAAVRAEVPDYARPLTGRFGMRITEGVSVALGQFIDLLGRDEPLGDASVYRALGQLEHREGRTLAALQSAYQVGTRTMWRRLGGSTTARQLPPEVIFSLAEALFSYVEQISAASVAGWAYEESSRASSMQARRHALVELLARQPPAAPAEVERVAAAAGWVLPGRLAALVVEDAVAVAGRLPGAIGADLDPVGVAIVSVGATRNGPAGPSGGAANPRRTAPAGSTGYGPGWAGGGRCSGRWSSLRRRTAPSPGRRRRGRCTSRACSTPVPTRHWPEPTSTCSRCSSRPNPSWPPTCTNAPWHRCAPCRPEQPPAARRRCGLGSTRTATSPPPPPPCTCTPKPCATALSDSATRSAGHWTIRRRGWNWR